MPRCPAPRVHSAFFASGMDVDRHTGNVHGGPWALHLPARENSAFLDVPSLLTSPPSSPPSFCYPFPFSSVLPLPTPPLPSPCLQCRCATLRRIGLLSLIPERARFVISAYLIAGQETVASADCNDGALSSAAALPARWHWRCMLPDPRPSLSIRLTQCDPTSS